MTRTVPPTSSLIEIENVLDQLRRASAVHTPPVGPDYRILEPLIR